MLIKSIFLTYTGHLADILVLHNNCEYQRLLIKFNKSLFSAELNLYIPEMTLILFEPCSLRAIFSASSINRIPNPWC